MLSCMQRLKAPDIRFALMAKHWAPLAVLLACVPQGGDSLSGSLETWEDSACVWTMAWLRTSGNTSRTTKAITELEE